MKHFTLKSLLIAASCCGLQPAFADDANGKGQALFLSNNCYLCHDRQGQGGVGPNIAGKHTPPLPGFITYLRNPSPSGMPAYTETVISDADLTAIWNYLSAMAASPSGLPEPLKRLTP